MSGSTGRARPSAALPRSPFVGSLPPYPFAGLDTARREAEGHGLELIDLGTGDPGMDLPDFVREALTRDLPAGIPYPQAAGLASLREAASSWLARRFGVEADPVAEVIPANGSKEAIFHLPLAVLSPERPVMLVPDPAYPVYALAARAAGGEVHPLPLLRERGHLPDLHAVPESIWRRSAVLWLNYPHNPTGAIAPLAFLEEAAALCRRHGVLLASDEAYSEIYFGDAPPSALQCGFENVLVFHTLSKRSGMAGLRSGFMAGDARVIGDLKRIRPGLGVATPEPIQEAARRAWSEEEHVTRIRKRFRARRDLAVARLSDRGIRVSPPAATFFLWLRAPEGQTSESLAAECLQKGVVVLPGSALGSEGEGYVRLSLVAAEDALGRAMDRVAAAAAGSPGTPDDREEIRER